MENVSSLKNKYCPKCNLYLPVERFKKLTTDKSLRKYPDGYYWCCTKCFKAIEFRFDGDDTTPLNRKWRRREKRAMRVQAVKNTYGLQEAEYLELIATQNNLCAICHKKDEGKVLCVDHDHKNGRVRGLLCHNCNVGIGNFRDDPKILESAIAYLLKGKDGGDG